MSTIEFTVLGLHVTWSFVSVAAALMQQPIVGGSCETEGLRCLVDTSCDDGDPCNGEETCTSNICQCAAALPCEDGDVCTEDLCTIGPRGVVCEYQPLDCDDGVFCNGGEWCQPLFGCAYSLFPACFTSPDTPWCDEDNDRCVECRIDDHCNLFEFCRSGPCNIEAGSCNKPEGTSCDDQDPCTAQDRCVQGECTGSTASWSNWVRFVSCISGPADLSDVFECLNCYDLDGNFRIDMRDAAVFYATFSP